MRGPTLIIGLAALLAAPAFAAAPADPTRPPDAEAPPAPRRAAGRHVANPATQRAIERALAAEGAAPAAVAAAAPPQLQSVQLRRQGGASAIVDGRLVVVGDRIGDRAVLAIDANGLLLGRPRGGSERLDLISGVSKHAAGSMPASATMQARRLPERPAPEAAPLPPSLPTPLPAPATRGPGAAPAAAARPAETASSSPAAPLAAIAPRATP